MRRQVLFAMVAVLLAGSGVGVAVADGPPSPNGGTAVDQCYADASTHINDFGYNFCRSVQAAEWMTAAQCRTPERSLGQADQCGVLDGRQIDEQQVAAYEKSWVHRALSLQRGLGAGAPLMEEQLPSTHNSFNSSAYQIPTDGSAPSYYPTLTNQDPNQVYSLTDQLRMDIRSIELDLHWVPSPYGTAATHGYWPTLCHGDGETAPGSDTYVHIGCSDDRPMQDGLAEVRRWVDANPGQLLVVYFENQLYPGGPVASQEQAHDVAASIIAQQFGSLVYKPPAAPAGSCEPAPWETSTDDILATGARILLVGNCGPGDWNQWVFTRGKWDESGNPTNYSDAQCSADQATREVDASFRRYFEERTWEEAVTAGAPGPLAGGSAIATPADVAKMTQCGVNIISLDQLQPFDGRLAAQVWSWAKDEPSSAGNCAMQGSDSRFHAAPCGDSHPFACVDGKGDWSVSSASGPWSDGATDCPAGTTFGVPPNGYRNAQLSAAKAAAGVGTVWLNYAIASSGGSSAAGWTPNPTVASVMLQLHARGHHPHGHAYGHGNGHGNGHGKRHQRHG